MCSRTLGVGSNDDVVVAAVGQGDAGFDGDRRGSVLGLTLNDDARNTGCCWNERCRLWRPGSGRWLRTGGLAVELRNDPVEAVEVVLQTLFDVVLSMANDADRAGVAGVANHFRQ